MLRQCLVVISAFLICTACTTNSTSSTSKVGSEEWFAKVDKQLPVGDGEGHGPDLGSTEWCGAVDYKLFNRSSGLTPCTPAWNEKVNQQLFTKDQK